MTISAPMRAANHPGRRGPVATISLAIIASATVFGLLIAGTVFLAMAVAFQIAVPIAQQYDVSVSAADMAMAARLAELWWVPGGIAIASLLAAAGVAITAFKRLDSGARS
jgi:hypothetical protein